MLKIKSVKPMFTSIVTTGERYKEDMYENGVIIAKEGDLKTYQKVVAIGSSVRDVAFGDQVMINITNYAVKKYDPNSIKNDMDMNVTLRYAFNWLNIEGVGDCLLLHDRDILFAFEGEEVQGTKNPLIMPEKKKFKLN